MRKLGVVAIVVTGLMIISLALSVMASSSVSLVGVQSDGPDGWMVLVPFLLGIVSMIGFGVWLVGSREMLASRLFDDSEPGIAIEPLDLLRLGITLIGLMLLLASLPRIVGAVSGWMTYSSMRSEGFGVADYPIRWWDIAGDTLIALAQAAIGVVFTFRSADIAFRLWSTRAAIDPVSSPTAHCPSCGAAYDPAEYRDIDIAVCDECHAPLGSSDAPPRRDHSDR